MTGRCRERSEPGRREPVPRHHRHVELLLLDRQRLVELAGGAGGHHVHVVRVHLGADAELRQVGGELGDAGLALAVSVRRTA